jgi:hypothetical protein
MEPFQAECIKPTFSRSARADDEEPVACPIYVCSLHMFLKT